MSKSDAIERLRAAARARSRSRERMPVQKTSAINYAPDVDEQLEQERARQRNKISKIRNDTATVAKKERDDPRKDDCTIIVQGLKAETDERQIYQFFAKCGKVRDVHLLRDNNSNNDRRGKGVAYVEFYAELKGSIGEGPNQANYSDQSSVKILSKFRNFRKNSYISENFNIF